MKLSARILRTLAESPLPVATPDLVAICAADRRNGRERVWQELRKLRDLGLVHARYRTHAYTGDKGRCRGRVAFWARGKAVPA